MFMDRPTLRGGACAGERPSFVLRGPPEDEALQQHAAPGGAGQLQQQQQQPPVGTAYVAHGQYCRHSAQLLLRAQDLNVMLDTYFIDTHPPPEWLPGTPAVMAQDGQVYCGEHAFAWIEYMAAQQAQLQASVPAGISTGEPDTRGASLTDYTGESERMAQAALAPCSNERLDMDAIMAMRSAGSAPQQNRT